MDRRDFVRTGGLAAAAGLATALAAQSTRGSGASVQDGKVSFTPIHDPKTEVEGQPPNPDDPNRRVGIAVIGLGRLATEQIIPAFARAKHARLAAVVSGSPEKARAIAAQNGLRDSDVYSYADLEKLKDRSDVEAVYIVLPNALHREYTLRTAAAGKHVLCEKPMAANSREAEDMIAACGRAQRLLMIAYRMQYEPYTREIIRQARAGELGTIKVIQATNGQNEGGDLSQWRLNKSLAGGGALFDIGIYCLNSARYVTGEEPIEISARTYTTPGDPRFTQVEEAVAWTMSFPSGCIADMSCSYAVHELRTMNVQGSNAWIRLDNAFAYEGQRMTRGQKRSEKFSEATVFETAAADQFALEIDHFAQCVKTGTRPHTPGEEGLQDHRVMEAILRSSQERRIVDMPFVSGLDTTRGPAPRSDS